ncbi:MAG: matrixin family metalloprotease [Oligoflexia bacterium]|nr:matrixin family metalloprotease [Oligoflexia bacterium]
MKLSIKQLGVIAFLIFQTHCAPQAPSAQEPCGFNQNSYGQRISWKALVPVKMYIDPAFPQSFRTAIQEAMNTWNKQLGKNILSIAGERSGSKPQRDNLSVIYWYTTWDQSTQESREEQANTTIHYADNQLVEADIQVNAMNFTYSLNPSYNEVDLQSVLIHELGHVLGLKHNAEEPSVMAKRLQNGTTRRNLFAADVLNCRCEY